MCGIIGIAGTTTVTDRLMAALARLEYRGYDSAGIAASGNGKTGRIRALGKLHNLESELSDMPLDGPVGIGHTRWATHGKPEVRNAHPHRSGKVTLVHNGIIENYQELKSALGASASNLESETDTEIATACISDAIRNAPDHFSGFQSAVRQFEGAYAIAAIVEGAESELFCAKQGSPLVVGLGQGENYIGSDAMALAGLSDQIVYLEDGDVARVTPTTIEIFDAYGKAVERPVRTVSVQTEQLDKGNYDTWMMKEIHEQSDVVGRLAGLYCQDGAFDAIRLENWKRIHVIACGTSYYAACVARYWFAEYARTPVEVHIASEFRYMNPVLEDDCLYLFVSQSGETADSLASLRHVRRAGKKACVMVNVPTSSMAREADGFVEIHAGPEIGVASTKAFTAQLTLLAALALHLGKSNGTLNSDAFDQLSSELFALPRLVNLAMDCEPAIKKAAALVSPAHSTIFTGRGANAAIALEGALKLKEISYIHAEGYPSGELKHGPIALVDENLPVIVLAPEDNLLDKNISNMQEVISRGGKAVLVGPANVCAHKASGTALTVEIPEATALQSPFVNAVAVQMLALHTADRLGRDIDQPRNLAKSVTVE